MGYIVGEVTSRLKDGHPSEIERISLAGKSDFDFKTAVGIAERFLEEGTPDKEIIVTTDRALRNVSEHHPELDVMWSSHDSEMLRNCYLGMSPEEWKAKRDHSLLFDVQSDKPSVYFDIDGTLGKWYADGRGYSSLEEIIDPANHYFRDIEPHDFMVELARELQRSGHDVCILSAADRDTIRDKMEWIHEKMPFIPEDNVFFSPLGADKTKFVKDNAEISVLIDDYNINLETWTGKAVKAINTVNSHQDKFPEIDMTVPERMMERHERRMEETERLIDEGTLPEYAADEIKSNFAETMARQIMRAVETVDTELENASKDRVASNILGHLKNAARELDEQPQNGAYFGYDLPKIKEALKTKEGTAELFDKFYDVDERFGVDPMYFGVEPAPLMVQYVQGQGFGKDYERTQIMGISAYEAEKFEKIAKIVESREYEAGGTVGQHSDITTYTHDNDTDRYYAIHTEYDDFADTSEPYAEEMTIDVIIEELADVKEHKDSYSDLYSGGYDQIADDVKHSEIYDEVLEMDVDMCVSVRRDERYWNDIKSAIEEKWDGRVAEAIPDKLKKDIIRDESYSPEQWNALDSEARRTFAKEAVLKHEGEIDNLSAELKLINADMKITDEAGKVLNIGRNVVQGYAVDAESFIQSEAVIKYLEEAIQYRDSIEDVNTASLPHTFTVHVNGRFYDYDLADIDKTLGQGSVPHPKEEGVDNLRAELSQSLNEADIELLNKALGIELSPEDAGKIDKILWENKEYDFKYLLSEQARAERPDIPVIENPQTINEAFPEGTLSVESQKAIYDIACKYDGFQLEVASEERSEQAVEQTKVEALHYQDSYGGTSDGYSITTSDGSEARLLMQENEKEIPPRMYVQSLGEPQGEMKEIAEKYGSFAATSKQVEAAYGEALQVVAESPDVSEKARAWASKALEQANQMKESMKENNFSGFEVDTAIGKVEFEAFPFQGASYEPKSIAEIDGYTTDNDVISGGGQNLYQYAAEIVNAEAMQRTFEQGKIDLQNFYDEEVFPIKDIPYAEMTEDQKDVMGEFSDIYKDYYNRRPRGDENICYQHHMETETKREAAMETDITSLVIDGVEEPMYEEAGADPSHVNFNVPMYDNGLQNIVDRTALLDQSVDYQTVEDVINSDTSTMNVYLDVDGDKNVKLTIDLDGEFSAEVPLTDEEKQHFIEMGDKALEKEGGIVKFIDGIEMDDLDKSVTIQSESVKGLSLELFGDGSGSASLNGKEFVQFDLATGETNFEKKGWEKWGTKTKEAMMNFAETYAIEELGANEREEPVKWAEEIGKFDYDDRTQDDGTAKHFAIQVGEDTNAGMSIFADVSGYLDSKGEIVVEFDDTAGNGAKGYTLDEGMHETYYDLPEETVELVMEKAKELVTEAVVKDILKEEADKLREFEEGTGKGANFYEIDLASAPDDKVSAESMAEWVGEYLKEMRSGEAYQTDFREFLDEKICDTWETAFHEEDDMTSALRWSAGEDKAQLVIDYLEEHYDSIAEGLNDHNIYLTYDTKGTIDEYQMNIMLATSNDVNYDGSVLPTLAGDDLDDLSNTLSKLDAENLDRHFDTALAYMVYQQGHDMTEVLQQLYGVEESGSQFVKEVAEALESAPSSFAELTASVRLDYDNLDVITQIGQQEGYITLPKGTEMCLYDRLNGNESERFTNENDFTFSAKDADYKTKSPVAETNIVQIYHKYHHDTYGDCTYDASEYPSKLTAAETAKDYTPEQAQKVAEALHKDIPKVAETVSKDAKAMEKDNKTKKVTDDFGNR